MARLRIQRSSRSPDVRDEVARLEERVQVLERENIELRRHGLRLAELMDVVEELLLPMAARDEGRVEEAIATYRGSL